MVATLTDDKPLAINIAAYIGLFNMLEAMIQATFEKAIGGDGTYADAILSHVQSISTRIDIVESVLETRKAHLPWANDALLLIERSRGANTYRNKLAHALYVSDGNRAMIAGNIFSKRKKFKMELITAQMVLSEFNKLQQLVLDFMHTLDIAPLGFPRKFDF